MARKSSKSPAEIRENLEKALANAKKREQEAFALENPVVAKFVEMRKSYSEDIAEQRRKFSGPNSFENRRKAMELRLDAINASAEYANALADHYEQYRQYADKFIANLSAIVAGGKTITEDEAIALWDAMLAENGFPTNESRATLNNLLIASENAEKAWRENAAGKAQPKGIAISAD